MNRFMRMMVFFDLPVKTKIQRRVATRFRSFLLKDGYFMMQYSVYCRVCNGIDAVEQHKKRLEENKPDNGCVRLLVLTEKQFERMEIIIGDYVKYEDDTPSNLSVF